MKLPWNKTATPEPPTETVPPPPPGPAPVAANDQAPDQTPPAAAAVTEPGGIDFTRGIASVVTAASAVFTIWSVWDLARHGAEEGQAAPHAVGLGAGIGVEAVWLWLLAIEWKQASRTGRVNPVLTRTGWALAAGAAVVLAVHGVMTSWPMALLAVLPLAAKAGWHWLTALRCEQTRARLEAEAAAARAAVDAERQAEEAAQAAEQADRERELALSTELTEGEERELAEIRRQAAYARARAAAETELTSAEAEADRLRQEAAADAERVRQETEHQMRQDALRRRVEAQMAAQQADADLLRQRLSLEQELRLMRPFELGAAGAVSGSSDQVPNDASGLEGLPPATAGFGFAQPSRPAWGAPRADLGVPPGASPAASPGAPQGASPNPGPLTGPQKLLAYVNGQGQQATVKGAARELRVDPRTVRRYRDSLIKQGHDLSVLGGES
ncbi:hypothetical protein ACWFMI_27330 [Nocardiopsis terrae]